MDMSRTALAINVEPIGGGPTHHIGTGFIVRPQSGSHFLVTAAHVPLGIHPHADWDKWPSSIKLWSNLKRNTLIDLFFSHPHPSGFAFPPGVSPPPIPRTPKFRYVPNAGG